MRGLNFSNRRKSALLSIQIRFGLAVVLEVYCYAGKGGGTWVGALLKRLGNFPRGAVHFAAELFFAVDDDGYRMVEAHEGIGKAHNKLSCVFSGDADGLVVDFGG